MHSIRLLLVVAVIVGVVEGGSNRNGTTRGRNRKRNRNASARSRNSEDKNESSSDGEDFDGLLYLERFGYLDETGGHTGAHSEAQVN